MINYATKSHWIISGFSCTDAHSGTYSEGVKEFYWKVVFNLKTPISLGVVVFRADYAVVYVSKIIFRHFHAKIDPVFGWSRLTSGWSSLDLCSFAPNICSMSEEKWQLYYKTVSYMKDFWVRYHHLTLPEMFLLNPVISRKCFVCLSNTSWNDCDANRKEAESSTSMHCFRSSSNISRKESYAKGCTRTCSASCVPTQRLPDVACKVDCCSGDYCANGRMTSTLVMMAFARLLFLFGY